MNSTTIQAFGIICFCFVISVSIIILGLYITHYEKYFWAENMNRKIKTRCKTKLRSEPVKEKTNVISIIPRKTIVTLTGYCFDTETNEPPSPYGWVQVQVQLEGETKIGWIDADSVNLTD